VNVHEKSDTAIVPKKVSNNGELSPAERLEGRAVLKWNVQPPAAVRTSEPGELLDRIVGRAPCGAR